MPSYNFIHFQKPTPEHESKFVDWQRRDLAPAALAIPGVQALRHFSLQPVQLHTPQLQPVNAQYWRFVTIYELETDNPANILPAITEHARTAPKAAGLLQEDATHLFELTRPFVASPSAPDPSAPFHVVFVMGNCIEGKEAEYDAWYDTAHSVEVLDTPDFIGMRRGILSPTQSTPEEPQPANRLVLLMIRTHDLHMAIEEFVDRACGRSASGIAWGPREAAASFASLKRTTHVFSPYSTRLAKPGENKDTPALRAQI